MQTTRDPSDDKPVSTNPSPSAGEVLMPSAEPDPRPFSVELDLEEVFADGPEPIPPGGRVIDWA
jgi:hypothetical protein